MVLICWPAVTFLSVTANVTICFNRKVCFLQLMGVQIFWTIRAVLGPDLGSTARGRNPVFDTLCYGGPNTVVSFWVEQDRQSSRACYPSAATQAGRPSQNTWLTKSKMRKKHGGNAEVQLNVPQRDNGLQEPGVSRERGCGFPPSQTLNEHSSRARAWKAIPVVAPILGHWVTVIWCDQNGFLYKGDYQNAWGL